MATLQRIRNRAGLLIAIIIGMAIFAFVIQDFIGSGQPVRGRRQFDLAEIDGQTIIKRAAGVPGDRVQVDHDTVRINGATVGEGLALAGTLKRPSTHFLRDDIVPSGYLWVMGATADSFDSRYWGFLPKTQVIGRAYALW